MALPCSSILNLVLISCLLFCITTSDAQSSFKPKALVLPVTKHQTTLQYIAIINQRTPFIPLNLTLDLGGRYFWVDCEHRYVSSSYKPARCGSAECSLANSKSCTTECYSTPKPGCNNNTCGLFPDNPLTQAASSGDLGQDIVAIQSTDGSNPGEVAKVPNFLFSCAATYLLEGLANGVRGMAGLGRTKVSFPSQFSAALKFDRKFAICLSSVEVKKDVLCLGFVDGGANPRTSIVIGGHQLEDNLLQFDVANSRLGFSSSLLSRQTNCANFNFTPVFNNEMGGYAM
ncbi:Probable aspartic proteinase GIP2 [Linum grandiflorum]